MNRLQLIGVLLACHTANSEAHSWYPSECCSDQDCMPADRVERDIRGDFRISVGNLRIWAPKGFEIRPSRDGRSHICFRNDKDLEFLMPLCLFMPAGS